WSKAQPAVCTSIHGGLRCAPPALQIISARQDLFLLFRYVMEQLEQSGDFAADCRRLFAPEHGRRWKTAAAAALAIGRTSLYRYLSGEQPVPKEVRARLAGLARQPLNPFAGAIFLGEDRMTP